MSMAERFHTPSLEDASYSRFLHPSLFFQTNALPQITVSLTAVH